MLPNIITITILNWEKHNPKRDQKTYTWLRLSNDIVSDPDLFGLTAEQKLVWIEILCQASKKNCADVTLNLAQLEHVTGVIRERIEGLLTFLLTKPIISSHDITLPHQNVTTTPTYERTERTTRDERTNGCAAIAVATPDPDSEKLNQGQQANQIIARYCELWKARYKTQPNFAGKWAGNAKTLLKDHGLKQSLRLVEAFLEMNDQWFLNKRHAFDLILTDVAKITHFAGTGVQVTQTQLRQADRTQSNANAVEQAKALLMKGSKND